MKKFLSRVKSFAKRSKVAVVAAAATIAATVTSVCASAATTESSGGNDMVDLLSAAGEKLQESFSDLVLTLIPVILGIAGTSLVIFGVMALYKFGKKIFGHVAG